MSPPSQFPPERSAHEADVAPRRGASSWPVSQGIQRDTAKAGPFAKRGAGFWRKAIVVSALGAGALVSSCFASSDGLAPPTDHAYFPTALVISKGRTTLYVANSDFDLQYSGGTVQALDLGSADGLRTRARALAVAIAQGKTQADACAAIGTKVNGEDFVHPGPCAALPLAPFVKKFATVGAFSSQGLIVDRNDGQPGARLFLTVRGDPSVTYFDVVDDRNPDAPVSPCGDAFCLDCGGTGVGKRCASSHLIGTNPFDNLRGIKLPTEPTGIDVVELGGASGDPLVIAHQTTNQVSLVVNRWPDQGPSGPTLEFSLGSLADGPVDVVHIPQPGIVKASNGKIDYRPGFIVSHRAAAELSVVRYEDDARAAPERPFLMKTQSIPITLSAQGNDSRGLTIDSGKRDACEAKCNSAPSCLVGCLANPLDLYVLSRAPASMIIGQVKTTADTISGGAVTGVKEEIKLMDYFSIPPGASGISVGKVVDKNGELATRIFAVSFDARFISVYDPKLRRITETIRTGRGPFGMAFDAKAEDPGAGNAEAYLYVGQFTDSYLSVVDLDTRRRTFGNVLVNVGPPAAPRGEQQ